MIDVSVVIPSVGRPSLAEAVESARAQAEVEVEVIVVLDRPDRAGIDAGLLERCDRVILTGGNKGGSHARNMGVAAATGRYVAFLDDDDIWLEGKLAAQLEAARALEDSGFVPVVASRIYQEYEAGHREKQARPGRPIGAEEAPQDYLFRKRAVGLDRPTLPTSTLLTTVGLARATSWDATLRRHQDWDWVIRAASAPNVRFHQLESAMAIYRVGSAGSISALKDWSASLRWALRWKGTWNDQTIVDFLWAQTMRYALQSRSVDGVRAVFHETRRLGRPSTVCVVSALLGLAPRQRLESLAARVARFSA